MTAPQQATPWACEQCGDEEGTPAFGHRICTACETGAGDEPDDACSNPGGHEWTHTGTGYGGDCVHCGADGDA